MIFDLLCLLVDRYRFLMQPFDMKICPMPNIYCGLKSNALVLNLLLLIFSCDDTSTAVGIKIMGWCHRQTSSCLSP